MLLHLQKKRKEKKKNKERGNVDNPLLFLFLIQNHMISAAAEQHIPHEVLIKQQMKAISSTF